MTQTSTPNTAHIRSDPHGCLTTEPQPAEYPDPPTDPMDLVDTDCCQ